jgi:hypothetical protein
MAQDLKDFVSAIGDFRSARSQADLQELFARLRGESTQLLSYDEVRQKLKLTGSSERGLKEIPIDKIVGSVGRYSDFTRNFLPRQKVNQDRWARVKVAVTELAGLPPIEVYQVGEVYFVKDGNHRVSVARQLGATYIQAYVTEIRTRVPLTADDKPDDLIIKAEYANFLEKTHLNEIRPNADLTVTIPGQYEVFEEHIAVHRYFMGLDQKRDISYEEAVGHWFDTVYLPVVQIIHEQGILQNFPDRTEADLYVWIAEHRAIIEKELGWEIQPSEVVTDLVSQYSPSRWRIFARLGEKILEAISLNKLVVPGPPVGQWRRERQHIRRDDRLFTEILVPLNGTEYGWFALEEAILVARREEARLHGLHVVPTENQLMSEAAQEVQTEFNQRCQQAGVSGELVLAIGNVAAQICSRARWTDLVITTLSYPPGDQPFSRLSSGFRDLIQRCPRPILAVPLTVTSLNQALLAYDGSPKAKEALYVATYLACQWNISLTAVSVVENGNASSATLDQAREYLPFAGDDRSFENVLARVRFQLSIHGRQSQNDFLGHQFRDLVHDPDL